VSPKYCWFNSEKHATAKRQSVFTLISNGYPTLSQNIFNEHNQKYGLLREAPFYLLVKLYTCHVSMKPEQNRTEIFRLNINRLKRFPFWAKQRNACKTYKKHVIFLSVKRSQG